ncbi:Uncharacterised protein [Mycobacteroides abscessus subsp. abscessus]|nr:Uncharacterised protein [Mycobacteroides abscessus subsp. abscessus]
MAADLDLFVGAAEVAQLPVGTPGRQVAGPVHARSRRAERARHETCCGQGGSAPVADPDAAARHVEFADRTRAHRPQPVVEHEQRGARHRRTDRRRTGTRRQRRALGHPHGRFGRAVHVAHDAPRRPAVHQLGRAGLGADQQGHRFQALRRQHTRRGRGLRQHRDVLADEQGVELIWRADHRVGHHHQAPAVQQGSPDLPHREVERIRVELCPNLFRTKVEAEVQPVEQLRHVAVCDGDALGPPGGS